MPARPVRQRLISGSCPSARSFAPRFLPTLGHPRAVALRFVRCGQLTRGLSPPRSRPCWAHIKKAGLEALPWFHRSASYFFSSFFAAFFGAFLPPFLSPFFISSFLSIGLAPVWDIATAAPLETANTAATKME